MKNYTGRDDDNKDKIHEDDIVMFNIKKDKREGYAKVMQGLWKGYIINYKNSYYIEFEDIVPKVAIGLIPIENADFIKIIGNKVEGEFEIAKHFVQSKD